MHPTPDAVSIVFVSWNRRYIINHVLQSILRNNFPFELIIIDNGSSDGTKEYLLEHEDEIDKLILNNENKGVPSELNRAIQLSTCPYISIQADDHVLHPNWLETMYRSIQIIEKSIPNLGYLSSILHYAIPNKLYKTPMTYEQWMDAQVKIDRWNGTPESRSCKPPVKYSQDVSFLPAGSVGNGGTIYNRALFKKVGLFRTTYGLRGVYDGEFKLRCHSAYRLEVGYVPETAFIHVKEIVTDPERYKDGVKSIHEQWKLNQCVLDQRENVEAAKRGVPPPTAPRL